MRLSSIVNAAGRVDSLVAGATTFFIRVRFAGALFAAFFFVTRVVGTALLTRGFDVARAAGLRVAT